MAIHTYKKEQTAAAADPPAGPRLDDSAPPPLHPGVHAPAPTGAADPLAMLPYVDDDSPRTAPKPPAHGDEQKRNDALAEMRATAYTAQLMTQRSDVDGRGHYAFLRTLEQIDDPLVRAKVRERFAAFTNEDLDDFIEHANWAGKRDKAEAHDLISTKRDAAEANIAAMTPERKAQLQADANRWAQQVLKVTRAEGANDDENAQKVANVLGKRTPEEIEAIRGAMRTNTDGEHTIYQELDRSLSRGNEDEAIAGLSGDPVHAARVGLTNASGDALRTKELLRGFTGAQLKEFLRRDPMASVWVTAQLENGADRREIEQLIAGRKDKADGERIANILEEPGKGGKVTGTKLDETTKRNLEDRQPANIIKELESKSPADLIAAEQAWDSDPAHAGHSFKSMVEARFGGEPSTNKLRIEALLRGDRAADRVYALREGMRNHNQTEIEEALTNPDRRSNDPAKKAAAEKELAEIKTRAKQLDEVDQRVIAMATGEAPNGAAGRELGPQLAASYADEIEHPKVEGNLFERTTIMAAPEANKDKREDQARDDRIATSDVLRTGELSTETQIYRADKKGDRQTEAQLLEGIKTNTKLGDVEGRFLAKYHKPMLDSPSLAKFELGAQLAKLDGDERPMEDIERDLARDHMNALELSIENVREYGAKAQRSEDVEARLEDEIADKQHSSALANEEKLRELKGGNIGTEDLIREQRAARDGMLEPSKDPFGIGPRALKAGVERAEYDQITDNLTSTLEVQRDEKTKLANKVAKIFTTIGKIAALAAGQPELVAAIDVLTGLAAMAIKKHIGGEAIDLGEDAKLLAVTAAVDLATVGIARVGSGGAAVGEQTAAEAVEQGVATGASEEIARDGAAKVAGEAGVAESELATEAEQTALATTESTEQAIASEAEGAAASSAGEGLTTAANVGVAAAGTVASGMIQKRSPGEIFGDVIKGTLTMFLPQAMGRRMTDLIGDASQAQLIAGELVGIGTEFTTNYAINGSIEEAFVMTLGTRLHTYSTGGLPGLAPEVPQRGGTELPPGETPAQIETKEPLALPEGSSEGEAADAQPSVDETTATGQVPREPEGSAPAEARQQGADGETVVRVVAPEGTAGREHAPASNEAEGVSAQQEAPGTEAPSEAQQSKPLSNKEVREQYNARLREIPRLDAEWQREGVPLAERARRASEIRHAARMTGRAAMGNPAQRLRLLVRDAQKYGDGGGPTFEQLVEDQHTRGAEGDTAYEKIIDGSQRSDPDTNARAARNEAPAREVTLPPGTTVAGDHVVVTGMNKKPLRVAIKRRPTAGPTEIHRKPDGTFELWVSKDLPTEVALEETNRELTKMQETPRQNPEDLGALYDEAQVAQEELGDLTREVAGELEGSPLVPSKLKGRERTQEKIAADYEGENERIVDLARSTIVFDTPQQVEQAVKEISGRVEVVRMKDRFKEPAGGYRDVMMNVRMPNGHIVEIQLHLKSILDVKNGPGHALYEEARTIEARAKKEGREPTPEEEAIIDGVRREMKQLYDDAYNQSLESGDKDPDPSE